MKRENTLEDKIEKTVHPIAPFYDENSKILILGSFPSVSSRRDMFFYAHPQNRFWKVLASVLERDAPCTTDEKRKLLRTGHIALWDVIGECTIEGSSDSSIKNVTPNDIAPLLEAADIKMIFTNGRTAEKYYKKYIEPKTGRKAIALPSTSPANAAFDMEKLIESWHVIKDFL